MPSESIRFQDPTSDLAHSVSEKVSDVTSQVKDSVSELGKTAVDKIDENRGAAANGLESAASSLHQGAERLPGGEKVTSFAHSAADKLSSTADYVKGHDVNAMVADVEKFAKDHPGPVILAAAMVGFLVGRAFTSND